MFFHPSVRLGPRAMKKSHVRFFHGKPPHEFFTNLIGSKQSEKEEVEAEVESAKMEVADLWKFPYLLMCKPIVSIIRISVNFFLYGSNFCIFTALGLMPRVSPCSLRTKNSLCCFGKLSFLTVSQLYIAFRWHNESVLMSMLSCLNAVLSTKFWPTAKQGINKRTINSIDFFGTIIQISIDLFLIRPDKPIARRLFHLDCEHFLYSAPINIGEDEVGVQGFALFIGCLAWNKS